MGYEQDKERRIEEFTQFWDYCESNPEIVRSVYDTREGSVIYNDPVTQLKSSAIKHKESNNGGGDNTGGDNTRIIFCDEDNLDNVMRIVGGSNMAERAALLYVISGTSPGDGVIRGSTTGEARLCRRSTLYFCLQDKKLQKDFYERNRMDRASRAGDICVYLPGVQYISGDKLCDTYSQRKQEDEVREDMSTIMFDVIGTAMPDVSDGSENTEEFDDIMRRKLKAMLTIAEYYDLKTIVILNQFLISLF